MHNINRDETTGQLRAAYTSLKRHLDTVLEDSCILWSRSISVSPG